MINRIINLFKLFITGGKPLALELTKIIEEEKKVETAVEKKQTTIDKPKKIRKTK